MRMMSRPCLRSTAVGSEEVLEKTDMLAELATVPEGHGRLHILGASVLVPGLRLEHVDDVLAGHHVDKATEMLR